VLLAVALLCVAPGCLNLGGKTYVQESPETEARLAGLETRVSALEHAMATRSTPPIAYESVSPLPGQPSFPSQPGYTPGR
jgi:hypothetical protein